MIFNDGYSVYAFQEVKQSVVRQIDIGDVIKIVSDYFSIPISDIMSKSHKREFVTARHTAIYLSKTEIYQTTVRIISEYFNIDHTSVLHACHNVENWKETDENFYKAFIKIKTEIKIL